MCDSVWVEKEIFPEEDVRFKPRLFYVRADDASVLQTHQHDVVYYGVVNLIDNNYVMGAVDVWRCRGCNQLFRSEEHTSELQSQSNLVCRLLLEKKKHTAHH